MRCEETRRRPPLSWVSAAVPCHRAVTQMVVSADRARGLKPPQDPENSRQCHGVHEGRMWQVEEDIYVGAEVGTSEDLDGSPAPPTFANL